MYIIYYYIYRETQREEIWRKRKKKKKTGRGKPIHQSSPSDFVFFLYTVGRATCWANKNPNQKSYFLNARQNAKKKDKFYFLKKYKQRQAVAR
jgi:hypothetical protein